MKINQIIVNETSTCAGSVAPVPQVLGSTQTRNPSIYGGNKVGNLLTGKKTNKPYANSLSEGKVKDLKMDLSSGRDGLSDIEFKKKYGKSKEEMRKALQDKPKSNKPVQEAKLDEEDLIIIPGQGIRQKMGFIPNDPDRAEHEGQTLKNSLHTIIRVATHLDRALSTQDNFPEWVSEKIGAVKSNMVTVMDYLISAQEMQHDMDAYESLSGGVIAGGGVGESVGERLPERAVVQALHNLAEDTDTLHRLYMDNFITPKQEMILVKSSELLHTAVAKKVKEGAKVDRMVKHIAKSERESGESEKEAESIAWATVNKRGRLDNKNKKK